MDDAGRVIGVEARGPTGLERHYGHAVIAASGGFQANPEMRTAYMGGPWGLVKTRGTRYNTGEVIRELLALGAQSFGDWAGRHATPIDADAPAYGDLKLTDKTNRLSYPYGIMVNLDGERFVDEGADFNSYTYAAMARRSSLSEMRSPSRSSTAAFFRSSKSATRPAHRLRPGASRS